jgi:hypothetical protein
MARAARGMLLMFLLLWGAGLASAQDSCEEKATSNLAIPELSWRYDAEEGLFSLTATLLNVSSANVKGAAVVVELYDASGNLVADGWTLSRPATLSPDEVGEINLYLRLKSYPAVVKVLPDEGRGYG